VSEAVLGYGGFSPWEQDGWGKRQQGSAPGFNLMTMTMRESFV